MTEEKGFLENMFDFSFSDFVTPKIIKFLFVIGIALAALVTVLLIVAAFGASIWAGIFVLIVSPIVFGLMVLYVRVCCELTIVAFNIAESTKRTACAVEKAPQQQ